MEHEISSTFWNYLLGSNLVGSRWIIEIPRVVVCRLGIKIEQSNLSTI